MMRRSVTATRRPARGPRAAAAGALAGLLAAAIALGVAELAAAITGPLGSPVVAVGGAAIDLAPVPVKDFAIAHFGSHDKTALITGILVLLAVAAAGILALTVLVRASRAGWPGREPAAAADGPGRRRFLAAGAAAAVLAAAGGGAGDLPLRRFSVAASRAQVRLPAAARPAGPAPAGLPVAGLTPFYTPNTRFYRVDTDLVLPQVAPDRWTLRIGGMVGREIELTFADLLRLPLTEADITLVCVSNEVGGPYAGNARWLGASLPALLRRAGLRRGADQVLSTSADGMTISTPLSAVLDGRQALLAIGMNGQPLPVAHGFPARMVVPGLYGYTSATKWVTRLEVTTFAARRAYWTQRGYAAQAPIETESRIDVPKPLAQVRGGRVPVAGVAWAPHRGITAVEVSVDGGAWHAARLAAADGPDTWRQWVWAWDATPGLHRLQVRATDGTGATQAMRRTGVFPSGATGWDSAVVTAT